MELAFESKHLRSICEDLTAARLELDDAVAESLKHRLADLQAAVSIYDLLWGNCRVVGSGRAQRVRIDLPQGFYIVLAANHPRVPLTPEGDVDWNAVIRVKIIHIGGPCVKK